MKKELEVDMATPLIRQNFFPFSYKVVASANYNTHIEAPHQ